MLAGTSYGIIWGRIKYEYMSCATVPPKDIRALEALVRERGFGWTLPKRRKLRRSPVPSGIGWVDSRLGGGLPRGAISEVTGPCSSGRTGLVLAALARTTQAGGIAAYIDTTDCLDPRSAGQAGVVLERLLWIRCGAGENARRDQGKRRLSRMDEAWQTANLVVSAGGFGVVAIDLGGLSMRQLGGLQGRTWARLKHAVEDTPTALIVLAEKHVAGSAADVVLELCRERTEWHGLLGGIGIRVQVVRHRARGADSTGLESEA